MKLITISITSLAFVGCAEGIKPPEVSSMISIPAGTFLFGPDPALICGSRGSNNPGQALTCADTPVPLYLPQVAVNVPAFEIDEHEVTNFQYEYCVADGGCTEPKFGNTQNRQEYYGVDSFREFPVVAVTWQQAVDYCTWAGKRLPTEIEWERVAKGPNGDLVFPSSEVVFDKSEYPDAESELKVPASCTSDQFNLRGCGGNENTDQVASRANDVIAWPSGNVFDMTGNVAEWTDSWRETNLTCVNDEASDPAPCATASSEVCITCDAPADTDAECYNQCNRYPCYKYKDTVVKTPADLLPTTGSAKVYRGANAITSKAQICTMLASDRSQNGIPTQEQNFLGFRCAR